MATVTEDLKQGHTVTEDRGAYEARRVYYVTGLVQPKELQIMEALQDPGIPPYLDPYPTGMPSQFPVYDKMLVRVRTGEPHGSNGVKVTILYSNVSRSSFVSAEPPAGNDGPDLKRMSASIDRQKTTVDRAGQPMTLTAPGIFPGSFNYSSEAETFVPVGELVFVRTETSPPAARMRTLVGKINSSAENNYAAGTLLCTFIDADSQDGVLWDVEYRFRYRASGWQHRDTWRAPDGKAVEGTTEQLFDVIETANFGTLGLDFSDSQSPW